MLVVACRPVEIQASQSVRVVDGASLTGDPSTQGSSGTRDSSSSADLSLHHSRTSAGMSPASHSFTSYSSVGNCR